MACILLINHDPLQLYVLTMLLQQDQDEIVSCGCIEDSERAIEVRDDIVGIVLDLQLVTVDWWRSYQGVQMPMSRSQRRIPILAISSHYTEFEEEPIRTAFQVDIFLSFPVDPKRFRQQVRQLVENTPILTQKSDIWDNVNFKNTAMFNEKYDHTNAMLRLTSSENNR